MSAITGIFYRDGRKVDPKLIKKMNDRLAHRGPDGSAVYCEGVIALGHQMLHTTSESLHEKLPFYDEKSGLVITADARIDNRKELSEELGIEDKEDVSDSYFILKAYEEWGEKCPEHLLGDFAFAIWDENEEQLFCARDHMGVKPFYYYLDDDIFVFGTEIKALFAVPDVPKELNEDMIAMFLMNISDYESTFYENISSFNPAHSLTISKNNKKKRKYWELDRDSEIIMDSDEDYADKFRELFKEAVKCRLRSAYPIGFQLSGGLDSSSVLCMAKKILNENEKYKDKINSFSIVFKDIPCDESFFIKKVTESGGIESNFVLSDNLSPLKDIKDMMWYQEQPVYAPNIALLWNMNKKMQEKNIRVVLGGEGGDYVISHGNYYFRDLAVALKWKKLFNELNFYSKNNKSSFYRVFLNKVLLRLIPEHLKKIIRPYYTKNSQITILNKEFAKRIKAEEYLHDLYLKSEIENNTAKDAHYLNLTKGSILPMELLDRTISAFSMEHRHPFLDKRLVEFCYSIPTEIKFKFGWNRYIMRIAMEDILPSEIQWRRDKTNFSSFCGTNLLLFEKNVLDEIKNLKAKIIEEYIDINIFRVIYRNYINENDYNYLFELWLVSTLYLWLKKYYSSI